MDTSELTYKRNFKRYFKGVEEKTRNVDFMNIRKKMNVSSRKKQALISNAITMSNAIRILNVFLNLMSYKLLLILKGTILVE